MKKILVVFHDNDLRSGATMSMVSNLKYMQNLNYFKIIAVVPKKNGELKEYLNGLGIKVYVFNYGGQVYKNDSIKIRRFISSIRCMIKSIVSYMNVLRFSKIVKDLDIVYSNTSTIYFGIWIAKRLQVKHIWHFREYATKDQNSLRLFGYGYLQKLVNYEFNELTIFISKALESFYKKKLSFNKKILMVYDDLEMEKNTKNYNEKKNKNQFNILITGSISEGKGQLDVIKAVNLLIVKEFNVKLFIAGKLNNYGCFLKKYVMKHGMQNHIIFCGFVDNMNLLYSQIDMAVVPSVSEAFGRVVIENMLNGICVIGANSGSLPELLENNRGILYEQGNIKDLANKIETIIHNPKIKKEMEQNANFFSKRFIEYRSIKKIVNYINNEMGCDDVEYNY